MLRDKVPVNLRRQLVSGRLQLSAASSFVPVPNAIPDFLRTLREPEKFAIFKIATARRQKFVSEDRGASSSDATRPLGSSAASPPDDRNAPVPT